MRTQDQLRGQMREEIERSGYYPEIVLDSLETVLAEEDVIDFVVHHEATFDREELRRHATVLVMTPTRLLMQHTDEHPADEIYSHPYASSVTNAVRLTAISNVMVTRILANPENYQAGATPSEVILTIGWGAASRLELEPATCGDPQCEADHGYVGGVTGDDLNLRFASAADGDGVVQRALGFTQRLAEATGKPV
ncbi:MAG: phosphodiesterase [Actinobacteria bacterium]|mgnify:CR=1 FL=1|nr:phosphodiesterase [Actinomycetota bacterium]